jgi:hypothetical protein
MPIRLISLVGLLLLASATATAQTHPCDQAQTPLPTIASGAPHRIQFCQLQSDQPEALIVVVDSQPFDLLPITAKTGPSATGKVLYETTLFLQVSKGTHVLTAATYNRNGLTGALQVGANSPPFTFAAVDDTPKPGAPAVMGISR